MLLKHIYKDIIIVYRAFLARFNDNDRKIIHFQVDGDRSSARLCVNHSKSIKRSNIDKAFV